jgi:hypothetical protein
MVGRCEPNEAKIMCDMLLEMKIKYGMVPSLDGKGAITSMEWIVWKDAAKKMKIHRSIAKPLRWSKTIGVGWNSWWMDISTTRLLTFTKHLNEKGIDQVCAEMQVRRLEKIRKYNKPTLETTFVAESIGWEGTYIGRIWQFMREINIKIKGPNKKVCIGDNFTTTTSAKHRWELDLIGRARNIWWKHQVRAPSVGHTYAEYWEWPIPFSTTMLPATTREYKEKGSHDELRMEQHNTRTWNKDKRILRSNTAKRNTDEEHDWEEGEKIERIMWAKWKGNKRLIWVHKIIKQVQGGWKVDMRETTRNSKEATRDKIEAQGKGGANARYGKQQLDKKVSQGFKWSITVTINPKRTHGTVKDLKGPIAIPMFTTNPNQHTAAHLLSRLPLHNGKKERTLRKNRGGKKRQRKRRTKQKT